MEFVLGIFNFFLKYGIGMKRKIGNINQGLIKCSIGFAFPN